MEDLERASHPLQEVCSTGGCSRLVDRIRQLELHLLRAFLAPDCGLEQLIPEQVWYQKCGGVYRHWPLCQSQNETKKVETLEKPVFMKKDISDSRSTRVDPRKGRSGSNA